MNKFAKLRLRILTPPGIVSPQKMWAETVVLCLVGAGLGWLVNPDDPLTIYADFPWIILVPVLVGLRYGFAPAMGSCFLLLFMAWGHAKWLGYEWIIPTSWLLGLLAVSLIAGEYRDIWVRKITQQSRESRYRTKRLNQFTRAYHHLKLSHQQLEQAFAMRGYSLESALMEMQKQLVFSDSGEELLANNGESLMEIFARFGQVQVAALLAAKEGRVTNKVLAQYGDIHIPAVDDPMLLKASRSGELVYVNAEMANNSAFDSSQLLACVPLKDSDGVLHAVLAIRYMPYIALRENNLRNLLVIAARAADMVKACEQLPQLTNSSVREFWLQLLRCQRDANEFELDGSLIAIKVKNWKISSELLDALYEHRRGLDLILTHREEHAQEGVILILMPLTSSQGAEGYRRRINTLIESNYGIDLETAEIRFFSYSFTRQSKLEDLAGYLLHNFNINIPTMVPEKTTYDV